MVGLVDQLFQTASNQAETVEKAFAWLCHVIVARGWMTISRSSLVSNENGWKSVPLKYVNSVSRSPKRNIRLCTEPVVET